MYELELERYEKEGLSIDDMNLDTNEAMIDLFTLKPIGILRLLDDESQFPKVFGVVLSLVAVSNAYHI